MTRPSFGSRHWGLVLVLAALALSALNVGVNVHQLGLEYIEGRQYERHQKELSHDAPIHWKYRVFTPPIIEQCLRVVRALGVPHPVAVTFIGFRVLQDFCMFSLIGIWYRRLGLRPTVTLLGLGLVAWGTTNGLYDSDLSFNTYMDVLFYLVAMLLLASKRYVWLVPLTALAALNRETCGMIPVLLAAEGVRFRPFRVVSARAVLSAGCGLVLFATIVIGLRMVLGMEFSDIDQPDGHVMGWDLLHYNTTRQVTWVQVIGTVGITPVLAACVVRRSPPLLQRIFWVLVPFWFCFHFAGALIVESRLVYVPFIIACVPAVLRGLQAGESKTSLTEAFTA